MIFIPRHVSLDPRRDLDWTRKREPILSITSAFSDEIKISYIKFDNGSRIIAFSAHPQAMAVYGGDVGLDEFAKHSNAELLWQTAQARVTWNYDIAVWSSHEGEDTLFNKFAHQARSMSASAFSSSSSSNSGHGVPASAGSAIEIQKSKIENGNTNSTPWNLYFKVTLPDAIELGLLDVINRTQDADLKPDQFIADCQSRSGSDEVFQQSYMCNPLGAAAASIVEWSAIERCRQDYEIERVHLEDIDIKRLFGEFNPGAINAREDKIQDFILNSFPELLDSYDESSSSSSSSSSSKRKHYLGFDVAASGQGDLAAFYIDEFKDAGLKLRALLTVRTEDWNFLKTVLFYFLRKLKRLRAAGDESGLGRQICWEASQQFYGRFIKVNFASKKHDLGFALMNQLSVAEKRFPRAHQDIAADFFALRKVHTGARWIFTEGRNTCNPVSHCDIAWAGALATHAHAEYRGWGGGGFLAYDGSPTYNKLSPEAQMLASDDPAIWRPLRY
jgi:phage FluMu gp28-like protein